MSEEKCKIKLYGGRKEKKENFVWARGWKNNSEKVSRLFWGLEYTSFGLDASNPSWRKNDGGVFVELA